MKSFIFRKVSILVFIWFLVSFFPLLVFGAEKSIFEGVPQFVVLPESTSEKEVELLPLLTGDKAIEIELLGGQTAVPVKGSSKKKKNAGGEEELSGFTLEQDEAKDENTSVWKIKFNQK